MKLLFTLMFFCSFASSAKIYKCEKDGVPVYSDRPCEKTKVGQTEVQAKETKTSTLKSNSSSVPEPKYIKFKWGGTACQDIEQWQLVVDRVEAKDTKPFRDANLYCKYLREETVVFGIIEKVKYKTIEFAKIEASNGVEYWVELAGVMPIVSSSDNRPHFWITDIRVIK